MKKRWKVSIRGQQIIRASKEEARKIVKTLLDAGVWWMTLDAIEEGEE